MKYESVRVTVGEGVCVENKSIIYCMTMANEAVVNMSLPFQQMYTKSFDFFYCFHFLWLLVFYEMHLNLFLSVLFFFFLHLG